MAFRRFETSLPGIIRLETDVFRDDRGYFLELFQQPAFQEAGLGHISFEQDNLSRSARGVLRGLHFQAPPFAQGKLVCVLEGAVLDVAVDIRRGSPTYGACFAAELEAASGQMLYIPPGFAHGFQVLSESCLFFYKCTRPYDRASEGGIRWNDPALGIPWHPGPVQVSAKDKLLPLLHEFRTPFVYPS